MRTLITAAVLIAWVVAPTLAQPPSLSPSPSREHLEALKHLRLGQDALRFEQFDRAETEFQAAIRFEPSLEMAHYGLGQVYMATKRYPASVRAYLGCREAFIVSNRQRALGDLRAQMALDDQISAIEAQETAVAVGGGSGQKFELDRTIADLRALQRRSTSTSGIPAWISIALGSAYFRSGAIADAEREYRAALEADPKLGEAHNNLAVVCLQTGRYAEAQAEVTAAEKGGFRVNPQLKADIKRAMGRS